MCYKYLCWKLFKPYLCSLNFELETMSPTSYDCEQILPYNTGDDKKQQITQMFDAISNNYDLMNRAMTLGLDISWRRKAIDSLSDLAPKQILDVATGTADFAIQAYQRLQPDKIIGIDLSQNMLHVGETKIKKLGLQSHIQLQQADCMQLPFAKNSFDAVTVAFGVRNFANLEQGCREMNRVLRTGGRLAILEMTKPYIIVQPFYYIYTRAIIPLIACLYSRDKHAYQYLPNSIQAFPQGKKMTSLLQQCDFHQVKQARFLFGVCTLYIATKA